MNPYVSDAYRLDTTPGVPSQMFAPPQGWEGSDDLYLIWLRAQFKSSHCFRQELDCAARSCLLNRPVSITGPFRKTLSAAISSINKATLVTKI
jgi:hypothetical protein